MTKATGVYIGKLVFQKREIKEDAGENDDLDEVAAKVVQFTHANKSHNSMINVVLSPEDAPMTHSVFNFTEIVATQPPADDADADAN